MEWIIFFVRFYFIIKLIIFIYFSNHVQGQDTLHVDVYDNDTIKNDKIGSLTIDLRDLYEKRIYY